MPASPARNAPTSAELVDAKNLLVRRWGEMGGYWGISRTMAEIHALLFVSSEPLCTDDIMAQLHVSRGNASMNLRALVDWGLIQRAHKLGDRKEYFVADTNVWHMFETITRERRRREVEPIIATIDRCREMVTQADAAPAGAAREFLRRLEELRDFLTTMGSLFELVLQYGNSGIGAVAATLMRGQNAAAASASPPPPARPNGKGPGRRPASRAPSRKAQT
ncbi:MAG: ArsR family transcriptional regulator [Phycisphaerales bacterium]|nr:ArsR family transcriptional regulator [Phycisphaerales bacterium]